MADVAAGWARRHGQPTALTLTGPAGGVGVELYTVFGASWTGELGTFPTDCTTHGICVYLDPDGTGPLVGSGPGSGTLTVIQLDGSSIITLDDVTIQAEDGQIYTMRAVTLTG